MPIFHPIPPHSTSQFHFDAVPYGRGRRYVKTYYHSLRDCLPLHTHDFYEINVICRGVGTHRLGKREILTRRGDVFILPPYRTHGYSCSGDLVVYHVLLSRAFTETFAPLLEAMQGYRSLFDWEPLLREHTESTRYLTSEDCPEESLQQAIDRLEECKSTEDEAAATAHTLSLIAMLCRACHRRKEFPEESLPRKKALTVVESMEKMALAPEEKWDVETLAAQAALSYSSYLRYFKELSGTTPSRFLTRCRIRRGAELLLHTRESILSVALSCGFFDSSHFIREFKREMGLSPARFRSQGEKKKAAAEKRPETDFSPSLPSVD